MFKKLILKKKPTFCCEMNFEICKCLYLQKRFQIRWEFVVPKFVHIFLGACMGNNIIHEVLISKDKRAGMYSPNMRLVIHQVNGIFWVFVVHTIHQCNATLFKQSLKKTTMYNNINFGINFLKAKFTV